MRTYESGVLLPEQGICNLAVYVTGYGYSGAVEFKEQREDFAANGNAMPECSTSFSCVLQTPDDFRISPSWSTGWGENGFGTIRAPSVENQMPDFKVLYDPTTTFA